MDLKTTKVASDASMRVALIKKRGLKFFGFKLKLSLPFVNFMEVTTSFLIYDLLSFFYFSQFEEEYSLEIEHNANQHYEPIWAIKKSSKLPFCVLVLVCITICSNPLDVVL